MSKRADLLFGISVLKNKSEKIKINFPDYFSVNYLSEIKNSIENSILKRLEKNHLPAKYKEVKDYILEKGIVTKCEFTNKFWSFHVNSNFQKIRWQLLKEGIRDDTSKDVPTYS